MSFTRVVMGDALAACLFIQSLRQWEIYARVVGQVAVVAYDIVWKTISP